ncbi:GH32 C-terminal domain-containing protein [Klebsiella pneumoniae]|nr:GH32 C-terminal domain-containing protein [Klebsiella pneumoniae]
MDAQQQRLVLERHYPQYGLQRTRSDAVDRRERISNLRIFFDSSSVEVFVNDGEACLSNRIYPQAPRRELALFAPGAARRH